MSGPEDTSNFDIEELRPPNNNANNAGAGLAMNSTKDSLLNIHLPFVGFTATFTTPEEKLKLKNKQILNKSNCEQNGENSILESLPPLPETAAPRLVSNVQNDSIDGINDSERSLVLENELRDA